MSRVSGGSEAVGPVMRPVHGCRRIDRADNGNRSTRSVTASRTPDRTRFKYRLKCAFRSRIPTVSICDHDRSFGPFGETGVTPSKKCSSAPLPEVRCDVQTAVEPATPRVGGRWSASTALGQARALQQGQGAVAHRSPRWPRSPSPWHKRIVGSPPTGWPPTVNQDGKCKLLCAEVTAPADDPYLRS